MAPVATGNGINPWWLGIFNGASAFNNSGMSLLDANMIPFENAHFVIITMGLMILAGNTAYPVFLRFIFWAMLNILHWSTGDDQFSETKETIAFILQYPRHWVAFEVLNLKNPVVNEIPMGSRILDGLFQAIAVRSGGFYIVPIANVYIGLQLVLLKPDFNKYSAKAQEIRQILAEYDPRFESASIDEAYLNITQYCAAHGMSPAEVVSKLRCEIAEKTNVTVSAGIAANTRLAKICSNMNKPNGQFVLANDRAIILEFMKALPCRKVNGVGRVFERELAALGINTCGDVFEQRMMLSRLFGEKACHFLKLQWTAEELEKDLRRAECKGRTLVLKFASSAYGVLTL
ncbi:MAG: hypothetical protein STHCBS139747_007373 [Sporothrix thermara]